MLRHWLKGLAELFLTDLCCQTDEHHVVFIILLVRPLMFFPGFVTWQRNVLDSVEYTSKRCSFTQNLGFKWSGKHIIGYVEKMLFFTASCRKLHFSNLSIVWLNLGQPGGAVVSTAAFQ